jgi:hypothetical protein
MLTNSCDYAQERLVNLLEGKFRVTNLKLMYIDSHPYKIFNYSEGERN